MWHASSMMHVIYVPHFLNIYVVHQSLVSSVMIDVELGMEDHGSIPRNCDREEAETT
jgi:hypothetical protein